MRRRRATASLRVSHTPTRPPPTVRVRVRARARATATARVRVRAHLEGCVRHEDALLRGRGGGRGGGALGWARRAAALAGVGCVARKHVVPEAREARPHGGTARALCALCPSAAGALGALRRRRRSRRRGAAVQRGGGGVRAARCRLSGEGRLTPRRERPGGVRCAVQRLAEAPLKLDAVRTRAPDAQPELPLPVLGGVDRGHLVDAQRAQRLFAVLRLEAREALLRQHKPELSTREVGTEIAAHQARLGRRKECRRSILARVVGARARSLARAPAGAPGGHG